jgi:hypothetical protein
LKEETTVKKVRLLKFVRLLDSFCLSLYNAALVARSGTRDDRIRNGGLEMEGWEKERLEWRV